MLSTLGAMAYHREKVLYFAAELLRRQPSLTLAEISESLHIHRHTLQRMFKANGWSFASIKQAFVLDCLERHFSSAEPTSLKQLWTELGFNSASAFARYVRHATGKSPSELRGDRCLGHSVRKRSTMSLDGQNPDA